MTRDQANALKPGDVIMVKMRVVAVPRPGTVGAARGWITAAMDGDALLRTAIDGIVVSCADAVTGQDLARHYGAQSH